MTKISFIKHLCSAGRAFCIFLILYLSKPGILFAAQATQIFVLHSYSHEYPWTHDQHKGFVQTLSADRHIHTLISTEYLDTKRRAYNETYASELTRHLGLKYADYKPDSIYVTDDNALLYARDHLSQLFPGTPVFFSGVNNYDVLDSLNSNLFTGIFERKEIAPNLEWLLNMDKDANDLIFIGDGSNTYQAIEREARKDLISYGLRATFIAEKRLDRALARLHDLPGKYLFLTTLGGMTDPNGKVLPLRDIMKSLALTGRIIISMEDAYILEGVLGGYVTSGQKQGMNAANLLLDHLHGKPVVDLPPMLKSPNTFIFDDLVLERYDIKLLENIRRHAIFLNPRLGIYEQYRSLILGSLIALAALLFLVVTFSLFFMSRKNRELGLAQKSAESANALYNQIAEQSRTVHWEANAKGLYTSLSDVSKTVIGYRPEEIVGKKHLYDLHPTEGLETFKTMMFEAFVRKEPFRNIENIMQNRDGKLIWVSSNAIPFLDSKGNLEGYHGSHTDITERKQAENALRESEERFRIAGKTAYDLIYEWDVTNDRLKWHGDIDSLLGYEQDEISSNINTWLSLIHPDDRSKLKNAVELHRTSKDPIRYEYRVKHKGGTYRIWKDQARPLLDDNGSISKWVGVCTDITELKRMEESIQEGQKMESIGTLAGGIAHDFNNILSSVIGFTELALDDVEKNSQVEDDLQEVYTAANRAKELVNQILTFARQSEKKSSPIQVDEIVKEVLKFIRSSIPTTIEIRSDINSDSLIMGNETQVHQIIMNLCTNAAHSMEDEGGVLHVNLKDIVIDRTFDNRKLDINVGDYIEISVSDTGTGIPPDVIDSIFEPYFTTKGPGEGTGMGLAMVYGIVESYGGKIIVESTLGDGTTFTIYLPVTHKRGSQRLYEQKKLLLGTERILFVDDEVPIAKMGGKGLERLGYQVTIRTSSVEALGLFKAKPNDFDLVITDMTMPNMTGDQLAMKLMQIRPDIPIIICTGYSKKISEETVSRIGIKALAYKPIIKADLAKTVRKVLDDAKDINFA